MRERGIERRVDTALRVAGALKRIFVIVLGIGIENKRRKSGKRYSGRIDVEGNKR